MTADATGRGIDALSENALAAIARARRHPIAYTVRVLQAPDGRAVVVLGETHLKFRSAEALGRALVDAFDLRGVETFPRQRVFVGTWLKLVIDLPRRLVRLLSFGLVRDSTIVDAYRAKIGTTFLLEHAAPVPFALHVASLYVSIYFTVMFACLAMALYPPQVQAVLLEARAWLSWHLLLGLAPALLLRRFAWHWVLHPAVAILTVRNVTLAQGTLAMLKAHPDRPALVIMGRGHVPGYARELIDRHGFRDVA